MNIVFINSTRKWGGVKTWTLDYGRALQDRGHRVAVILRPATPFEPACRDAGFHTYPVRLGAKYSPVGIARVVRVLRAEAADVAVVNISKDLNVGAVAARLSGVPVVHRVGLLEDYQGRWEERWQHRYLIRLVIVPAQWMKDRLPNKYPWIRESRIGVVPNSKSLLRWTKATGSGCDIPVFGMTSQLSRSKGHLCVLQAVSKLVNEGIDINIRIAGTGPMETELKEVVGQLSIEDKVSFHGFQKDVCAFLKELDGFVLASDKEGFPNALLEALATGLPVVASDLPGNREMLGGSGLLFPSGVVDELADRLRALARNGGLRDRLGRAARRRAQKEYDLERNVVRLERLLLEAAGP